MARRHGRAAAAAYTTVLRAVSFNNTRDDLSGVDRVVLDRLKPWLAEVALASALYGRSGADTANGVEQVVSARAPATVRRRAFETPALQLGLFDEAPLADQIASLGETLRELDTEPDTYDALVKAKLSPSLNAWLHHGRRVAGDPRTARRYPALVDGLI